MSSEKRTVKVIQAEIARLQGELADIQEEELKMTSAVHILENLGWRRLTGKWVRPEVKGPVYAKGWLVKFEGMPYRVVGAGFLPNTVTVRVITHVSKDCSVVLYEPENIALPVDKLAPTNLFIWAGFTRC